jgi:hypothetical protein
VEREQLTGPLLSSATGSATISGRVLGPEGISVCDYLVGDAATINVTAITAPFGASFPKTITCPDDGFTIEVPDPGSYRLLVVPYPLPSTSRLPTHYLDPEAVAIDDANVERDVQIDPGTVLGGGAWLYGDALPGTVLQFFYAGSYRFAPGANSDWTGAWTQFQVDPRAAILQPDVRYTVSDCERLGHTSIGFPRGPFLFPDEVAAINCRLEVGPTASFTHQKSRLIVTPFPGDIGGLSLSNELEQNGMGFGVQFPADEPAYGSDDWVTDPRGLSQLHKGGLIVGVGEGETGVVLTGFDMMGYGVACGAACRDFGLDAVRAGENGRRPLNVHNGVLWQYSDALSPEGVGLDVQQRSFNPPGAGDYVLVEFTFKNKTKAPLTFYAGFWGDWDIDEDVYDDAAYVYFTGVPLLIQKNENDGFGSHLGTMLLGEYPTAGYYVYSDPPQQRTIADQLAVLRGATTATFCYRRHPVHALGRAHHAPERREGVHVARDRRGRGRGYAAGERRAGKGGRGREVSDRVGTGRASSYRFLNSPLSQRQGRVFGQMGCYATASVAHHHLGKECRLDRKRGRDVAQHAVIAAVHEEPQRGGGGFADIELFGRPDGSLEPLSF